MESKTLKTFRDAMAMPDGRCQFDANAVYPPVTDIADVHEGGPRPSAWKPAHASMSGRTPKVGIRRGGGSRCC